MGVNFQVKFNVKRKYKYQGMEYNSLDEMPPDVRKVFEKAMPAGIDLEHLPPPTSGSSKFVYQGKEYHLDELPPEARAQYEKAMEMLKDDKKSPALSAQPEIPDLSGRPEVYQAPSSGEEPIGPKSSGLSARWLIILIGLAVIGFMLFFMTHS